MTYRKAWAQIKAAEERLGINLVEKKQGGKRGGGTCLTKSGEEMVKRYEKLTDGIDEMINRRFKKIFRG